jgi:hypothetical protein
LSHPSNRPDRPDCPDCPDNKTAKPMTAKPNDLFNDAKPMTLKINAMTETFDIINAINRLRDKVTELSSKIDYMNASPLPLIDKKYIDEATACKILHVYPRILVQMRTNQEIPFIKIRRRFLYLTSDLDDYLYKNCKKT